jgi:hypothetical protein
MMCARAFFAPIALNLKLHLCFYACFYSFSTIKMDNTSMHLFFYHEYYCCNLTNCSYKVTNLELAQALAFRSAILFAPSPI